MTYPRRDISPALDGDLGDEIRNYPPTLEVGRTGLKRASGYVQDEFLPQLRGRRAVKVYREMWDNSPVVNAYVYTVIQLLRQIEWRVEPASSKPADRRNAEFVEQNMADMEHSFGDFVSEACSMIPYGWSVHEMVFKRRQGLWARNPANRSQYDDGLIGWRKFPIRGQDSLLRWVFADDGDVRAMVQMPAPTYEKIVLPMRKCLLFRTTLNRSNPEGRSLLRSMYRPWFMVKRFEEIEAVGVERDLTGLPVAYVPVDVLNPKPGTKDAAMLAAVKQAVQSVRRNEQEGLVWPSDRDEQGNLTYDFKLLTSGGSRQFDIGGIIQRYETRMLMSAMADFIMTGHENTGASYALHTDKSGIFETGINGIALAIAEPINRKAIAALFALNGERPAELPRIVPNDVNPPDLTQLASFIMSTAGAGMQWFPDGELEKFIRDAARLPQTDDSITDIHDQEQRMQAILSLVSQKMQMVQMDQQAAMGAQQVQQGQQAMAGQQLTQQGQILSQAQQLQQLQNPQTGAPGKPGNGPGAKADAGRGAASRRNGARR